MLAKHRSIPEIIKGFKFQSRRDDCWATCIHNILKEFAERAGNDALRLSEAKLNRAMGYGGGYGAVSIRLDRVAPNINGHIMPLGYQLLERREVAFKRLKANLASEDLSYPIAGLSYEYLKSKKANAAISFQGQPPEVLDHAVVLVEVNETNVTFFDPMERFGKSGKGGDGIIMLSTPSFLSLWSAARVDREWLMFVAPIPKKGSRTLDYDWEQAHATTS